jgi:hypothetical protein
MSKLQAFWVHGTSVQAEREGYFIGKQRARYGARFRTHGEEWFNFAIPTPVILDGQRSSLKKVFVLYDMEGTAAKIIKIHIYDGSKLIKAIENLSLGGSHSEQIDQDNSWIVAPAPQMKYGLGLSVLVDFGKPTQAGVPVIKFTTVGADFETP